MGFFKRKGSQEIIDLSDMQKRGLLSVPAPATNEEGVVDFSSSQPQNSAGSGSSSGEFGFLSSLAGAGSKTESDVSSPGPITSSLRDARHRSQLNSQINEIKLKAEDNEYKIRRLSEKIMELEEKLKNRFG